MGTDGGGESAKFWYAVLTDLRRSMSTSIADERSGSLSAAEVTVRGRRIAGR
jgi:hypothetical protein